MSLIVQRFPDKQSLHGQTLENGIACLQVNGWHNAI